MTVWKTRFWRLCRKLRLGSWKSNIPILLRRPACFLKSYPLPLLILLIGSTADIITTQINMNLYGPQIELHLAQRLVMQLFPSEVFSAALCKTVQVAFVLAVASLARWWCGWLIALAGLLYGLAALSNHFLWL